LLITRKAVQHKSSALILYCKYCSKKKPYTLTVTTNFRLHLLLKYNITANKRQNATFFSAAAQCNCTVWVYYWHRVESILRGISVVAPSSPSSHQSSSLQHHSIIITILSSSIYTSPHHLRAIHAPSHMVATRFRPYRTSNRFI